MQNRRNEGGVVDFVAAVRAFSETGSLTREVLDGGFYMSPRPELRRGIFAEKNGKLLASGGVWGYNYSGGFWLGHQTNEEIS